jgi:hypothetical protein
MSNALRVGQTFTDWREIPEQTPPCVYALVDPRTPNTPRYLGSTIQPGMRLKKHAGIRAANEQMRAWKDAMRADGVSPAMRIVAVYETEKECRSAEWKIAARWERRGIALFGEHVPPLWDSHLAAAGMYRRAPFPPDDYVWSAA